MTSSSRDWPVRKYESRHQSWPYKPSDFSRQDPSSDTFFYSSPRFVTHIDDAAIESLSEYYDAVLPRKGKILDFCSSWVSHYPPAIAKAIESGEVQVTGMGMSQSELDANKALNNGRIVKDLNADPNVYAALQHAQILAGDTAEEEKLAASTNVVSVDYLTAPVDVLKSVREATRPGGSVHLTISNRCFPTKAINRWLVVSEKERLDMVGDYLHFAGWEDIEIVELSSGKTDQSQGVLSWMGMRSRDPLWVVRAVK